jgi:serine/threonine-protein kinase
MYNYLPSEECLTQLKQAIKKSLQLDYEIAESHIVMARMKFYYDWDFIGATIEFKKAIDLNPNIAEAHEKYALCLGLIGNYTEAVKHASIASSLDPFSLMINFNVAIAYGSVGDFEKELEYGRRLIELEPNFYGGHFHVGFCMMISKRYNEAVTEFEIAVQQNFGYFSLHYLGLIYGAMGEKAKAWEVIEMMKNLESTQGVGNCDFGAVYMALGEFDKAFQYFEKAIEKHEGRMLFWKYEILHFPEFERDPRTKQILDKIGLPCQ